MSLNLEQSILAESGRNATAPFDIGACFDSAMAALKRDFLTIVLGYFVWMIVVAVLTATFVGLIIVPALGIGFFRFNLKAIRNQSPSISDLFDGFDLFGPALAWALVQSILIFVGYIFCLLPGIYLAVAWHFSGYLLADKKFGFWECMEVSRRIITAHWGWALLLIIVGSIIAYAGLLACLIGILVTIPFYGLMFTASYSRAVDVPVNQ
jgi:uncharacterized membrane protein